MLRVALFQVVLCVVAKASNWTCQALHTVFRVVMANAGRLPVRLY